MYKQNYLKQNLQNGQATDNDVAKNKRERGITLIALIVGIIVLLILARSKHFGNYGE